MKIISHRTYRLSLGLTLVAAMCGAVGVWTADALAAQRNANTKATSNATTKTTPKAAAQSPARSPAKTTQPGASKPNTAKPVFAKKPKLTPEQLRALIEERLARNPYYTPGFLISHGDVEPIFNYLLDKGVTVAEDQEDLYGNILSDRSSLVRLLKTPDGRALMKKIGNDAAAYDRLERLSWTFDGRALIERFKQSKDGYVQFQKLKTAEQLAKVSKEFKRDPRTQDFQLPTGHVHTASELIEHLQAKLAQQSP